MTISGKSASAISRRGLIGAGIASTVVARTPAPAVAQAARRDLRIGSFGSEFGNLSPLIRWDTNSAMISYNVFDQLVRVDAQARRIVPWLAESWSNPDPLTWRIKLREGVKWHAGYGEFTAEDVAYTWRFHIDNKTFQLGTAMFAVDAIKVDGTHVLEVKTKIPFGAFPGVTMGYGGIIACAKAHREMGHQAYSLKPIGHGPYSVVSNNGPEVVLAKNPDYWRSGFPKLDRLVYRAIPDSMVRLQALIGKEFDFITHPDPKSVATARENRDYTTISTAGWNWDYTQFNVRSGADLPFKNKLVRQAISYAIDRQAIVDEIYSGQATATDNQIPPGFLGHRRSMVSYPARGDLARAKELIARSGTRGFEVEVITSDKDWLRRELELVSAMVGQIGINFKIRGLDLGGFNGLWLNRKYDINMEDITLVAPDPDATSWWFLHSKGSVTAHDDPAMDKLLDEARGEADVGKRETLYHGVVDRTLDDCYFIYHCNVNYVQVHDRRIKGYTPSPQEYVQYHDTTEWST